MSARSSLPRLGVALALVACGKDAPPKPEADPAKFEALAKTIARNPPGFAGHRECTAADHAHPTMSIRTLLLIAKETPDTGPEREPWINVPELDTPAARTLLESTEDKARRQAAAELLAAKAFMVYRIDAVAVPLALGMKELKRGMLAMRAVGYDASGNLTCVKNLTIQPSKAKAEWAMKASDRAEVSNEVITELRKDLVEQMMIKLDAERATP